MSHLSHIQLLFTGGIPLSLYCFHRLADEMTAKRGVALGLALAAQALACAYYGVFAGLIVGYATLVLAATRRLWRSRAWWQAIATAAAIALAITMPVFMPFLQVQHDTGFARTVEDTARWSARPIDYLVSA